MAEPKKGRGCFFYGCVTLIVAVTVGIIAVYFAARYAVKKAVDLWTSPTPVAVAPVRLPASEGERAQDRLDDFSKSLRDGSANEPLVLTSDELDYLVRNSKGAREWKDSAHVVITNDQIRAQISIPLEAIRPELKGRFLNGMASLEIGVRGGAVVLDLKSIEVNGEPLPGQFLEGLNKNALEWRPSEGDKNAELVKNLGRLEIKDGQLVLHPKSK